MREFDLTADAFTIRSSGPNRGRPSLQHIPFFNWRMRSLASGTALSFAGIPFSSWWAGFAHTHATLFMVFPVLLTLIGIFDTARCMRKRWDFYHAGVLLLLYADVMALSLLTFLFLYPYLPSF